MPLENGIASHDTIARVFAALDSAHFQACFLRWMGAPCSSLAGEIVAVDGKTARGSRERRCSQSAIHMVSAFVCGHGFSLGQSKTVEKSNVTFKEDAYRIRADHAPENLSIVREIAMHLLRLNLLKRRLPKKRLKACLNSDYLAVWYTSRIWHIG